MSVTQSIAGNVLSIQVRVMELDTTGFEFRYLVLLTLLLEDEITYSTPPGANGETAFRDVMRAMLPSAEGEQIVSLTPGNPVFYQRQTLIARTWDVSSLRSVAFVQDKQTKIVYQAGSTLE